MMMMMMMKSRNLSQRLVIGALLSLSTARAFSTKMHTTTRTRNIPFPITTPTTALDMSSSSEEEEVEQLLPETSFGAEAVPEEQRPVNEYLVRRINQSIS